MELPLEGIKLIDFTGVQAGPACTQLLAWFGADVVKVERPGVGDVTRHQLRDIPDLDALYFTQLNSNKRSLELDTKTPEGKAIMEKLIREADVLVENFRPGAMDRMVKGLFLDALLCHRCLLFGYSHIYPRAPPKAPTWPTKTEIVRDRRSLSGPR